MTITSMFKPFNKPWHFLVFGLFLGMINSFFFNSKLTLIGFVIGTFWSFVIWSTQWMGHAYLAHKITLKFPWEKYKWKTIILRVISIVVYSIVAFFIVQLAMIRLFHGPITKPIILQVINSFPFVLGVSFIVSFSIAIMEFYRNWKKAVLDYKNTKAEMMTYKYDSLRNQINPHFLFNSLNVLSELVIEDQQLAVKFIQQLSKLYRYVLESSQKELITLQEEFAFIESYKFLLETRYESGLKIEVPTPIDNYWIVPLSVQLLIENAVKHNVISEELPLTIGITLGEEYLEVKNPYRPKKIGEKSTGKGLENITSRYQFFTDKTVDIHQHNDYFIVRIPLIRKS